jgi:hypothetical protein
MQKGMVIEKTHDHSFLATGTKAAKAHKGCAAMSGTRALYFQGMHGPGCSMQVRPRPAVLQVP